MKKITKDEMVLKKLLNGRRLSVREIFAFGINSPTKVISNLREIGTPIDDEWKTSGKGERYKVYFITKDNREKMKGATR